MTISDDLLKVVVVPEVSQGEVVRLHKLKKCLFIVLLASYYMIHRQQKGKVKDNEYILKQKSELI